MCYNYELSTQFNKKTRANALFNMILDMYDLAPKQVTSPLEQDCREGLLETIGNFKRKFKTLNNLAKFTEKSVL